MNYHDVMELLKQNSNESRRKSLLKGGAKEPIFGVLMGFLRKLAEQIGKDHQLAFSLWNSKNTDARFLAVMLFDPKQLEPKTVDELIDDMTYDLLLDDFMFRLVNEMPTSKKDELERMWYVSKDDHRRRAAWALIVKKIADKKYATNAYLDYVLEIIEKELVTAAPLAQWMMNRALCEIGFRYLSYTNRCLSIGERLGVYKDMMVAPGCTSAYAPDWIHAVLKRGKG